MSKPLENCPFCGEIAKYLVVVHQNGGWFRVDCGEDCGARGPLALGRDEAICKWNKRKVVKNG